MTYLQVICFEAVTFESPVFHSQNPENKPDNISKVAMH
jgi:hypothetical protein